MWWEAAGSESWRAECILDVLRCTATDVLSYKPQTLFAIATDCFCKALYVK